MTPPAPEPVDLAVVAADDALLDALGRGAPAPADDEFAELLAAWRAELSASGDPDAGRSPAPDRGAGRWSAPGRGAGVSARRPRRRVWAGAAAAALILLGSGLIAGTATATPHSPLWPLAAAVDPARADVLTADNKLADARRAIADGRYADAQHLVDEAAAVVARIRDPQQATRLTAELADVRRKLSGARSGTHGAPGPTPAPAPWPSAPVPSAPHPSPSAPGNGLPVPGVSLPGGILPSLPLPTPSGGILPGLP